MVFHSPPVGIDLDEYQRGEDLEGGRKHVAVSVVLQEIEEDADQRRDEKNDRGVRELVRRAKLAELLPWKNFDRQHRRAETVDESGEGDRAEANQERGGSFEEEEGGDIDSCP